MSDFKVTLGMITAFFELDDKRIEAPVPYDDSSAWGWGDALLDQAMREVIGEDAEDSNNPYDFYAFNRTLDYEGEWEVLQRNVEAAPDEASFDEAVDAVLTFVANFKNNLEIDHESDDEDDWEDDDSEADDSADDDDDREDDDDDE